jgi:hypothetical protein
MNYAKLICGILLTLAGIVGVIATPILFFGIAEVYGFMLAGLIIVALFLATVAILIVGVRLFIPQIRTSPLPISNRATYKNHWQRSFAAATLSFLVINILLVALLTDRATQYTLLSAILGSVIYGIPPLVLSILVLIDKFSHRAEITAKGAVITGLAVYSSVYMCSAIVRYFLRIGQMDTRSLQNQLVAVLYLLPILVLAFIVFRDK